jgi:hypothetical protein
MSENYEAHHYIFPNLMLLSFSWAEIFSLAPCSQIPSVYADCDLVACDVCACRCWSSKL